MLHFDMSPDPKDGPVKAFPGPLGTRVLIVGDLCGIADNRSIDDRIPVPLRRWDFERTRVEEKLAPNIAEALSILIDRSPPEVEIDVVNATKDDLTCDFDDAPTLRKSGFFKLVNQYNHQGMRPYSLLVFLDSVQGYLLQQLALVGRGKNIPIFVESAEKMDTSKPEARFVVPCPRGALVTAIEVMASFRGPAVVPNLSTCGGTSLSSLLWLTRFVHQILHIDHHRGSPSQDQNEQAMMEILNDALATRLQHRPEITVQLSQFEWKRPVAEAMLSVSTPDEFVQDKIVLQFEFS